MLRLAFALMLLPLAALAQQPDPRLSGPMIQALQAQLAFQQALLRAHEEDAAALRAKLCEAIEEEKRKEVAECAKLDRKTAAPKDR